MLKVIFAQLFVKNKRYAAAVKIEGSNGSTWDYASGFYTK